MVIASIVYSHPLHLQLRTSSLNLTPPKNYLQPISLINWVAVDEIK